MGEFNCLARSDASARPLSAIQYSFGSIHLGACRVLALRSGIEFAPFVYVCNIVARVARIRKGIEITVLDTLVFSLYLSLPRGANPLPFRAAIALYLCSTLLSVITARVPEAALFVFLADCTNVSSLCSRRKGLRQPAGSCRVA